MPNPLDLLLPIRKILIEGKEQPFARDLNFEDTYSATLDNGVLTLRQQPTPWKASVLVAVTTQHALSGLGAIDGVGLAEGSRVLLTGQTNRAENGPWAASAGGWSRPSDFADDVDVVFGSTFYVLQGSHARSTWTMTDPSNPVVSLGTSELTFTESVLGGGASANASNNALAMRMGLGQF